MENSKISKIKEDFKDYIFQKDYVRFLEMIDF